MYPKNYRVKWLMPLLLLAITLSFCAYRMIDAAAGTVLQFSFNTAVPADSYDEKNIQVNRNLDRLTLSGKLKIDSGDVTVQMRNTATDEILWSETYQSDAAFRMELENLKAEDGYKLEITAAQSKHVKLTVSSSEKLVKDKERPNNFSVPKK